MTCDRFVRLAGSTAAVACSLLLAAAPAAAQNTLQARNLAATCANCHGTDGNARPGMVALAGMPAERLLATVAEFKSGARPATIMHQIARGYSDEQMKLVAAYFAAQQPAR